MKFRLSILMAALESRAANCVIQHQIQEQLTSEVEFLTCVDNGERTSGAKRHELVQRSQGEYLAFVDDDDFISKSYIVSLLQAINSDPDVVTFNIDARFSYVRRGKRSLHENEIWELGYQEDDRKARKMGANHLCAWKRRHALSIAWCPDLGNGDDQLWYRPLFMSKKVKKEVHIDDILYTYEWVSNQTSNQTQQKVETARAYFGPGIRCFMRQDGVILVESNVNYRDANRVLVRDNLNNVFKIDQTHPDLKFLGTVRFK